ncbi:MAG: hypothetical protein Kow0031_11710 [Anaerolineae bacterium]
METAASSPNPLLARLQQLLIQSWLLLRRPQTTLLLLLLLVLVLAAGWLLPQRPTAETPPAAWVDTLPVALHLWAEPLYLLGFSRVFYSIWFWGPLALLLLNCLLSLADYGPASWRRYRRQPAELSWQHPLARRVEQSVRLSAAPDEMLAVLKEQLAAQGFTTSDLPAENDRAVSAARRRWSWLAAPAIYVGLLLLVAAFLATTFSLKTEQYTVWPFNPVASPLFQSEVELYSVENGVATVIFTPTNPPDAPALALFLQPNRPAFFKQVFIWPTAIEPVLTIEARDSTGAARRLMPVQTDLAPTTRLSLPLNQPDAPLYFLIPSANLAFQLLPADDGLSYQVQVRRGDETTATESFEAAVEQSFQVDDISVRLTTRHNISLVARRDFGLPLLVLGLLLAALAALLLLALPPWQVWLIPEVKGRGGQLYGVAETVASPVKAAAFLDGLLADDSPTAPPGEDTPPPQPVDDAGA